MISLNVFNSFDKVRSKVTVLAKRFVQFVFGLLAFLFIFVGFIYCSDYLYSSYKRQSLITEICRKQCLPHPLHKTDSYSCVCDLTKTIK